MDSVGNMVYQVPEFTGENIPVAVAAKIYEERPSVYQTKYDSGFS